MQAYDAMFAFGFQDTRAAPDGPMMRLGDRSAPLSIIGIGPDGGTQGRSWQPSAGNGCG